MRLTKPQARRIALAAQGIGADRDRPVGMRQVQSTITRLGQFQIDSVNVLARAHLMPLYTRVGAYDPALLTRAASTAPRRLFEYWGHAASLIDIRAYPAFQFRRDAAYAQTWSGIRDVVDAHPRIIEEVADAVAASGPVTARDLDYRESRSRDQWGWNWSLAKTALEWLFWCGRVAVAGRNSSFERVYDIPERVIPADQIAVCEPWAHATATERAEMTHGSHVALARRAARALGVGTARCLGDYFRTAPAPTRAAIADLVASGELIPAEVDGVREPAWVWHDAARPRQVAGCALVSPFDSLVFERKRLAAFFDTDYSLGLYTPAHKRIHGYYVYLFLLDDRFVARADLKADRAASTLMVRSAWLEPGLDPQRQRIASRFGDELRRLAEWLGMDDIHVDANGDVASDLRDALG
ncbi:MAG: winged helix DNA-binding domain-containing protein [Propionibacteriaceae bacterium]|nr:winged helix DNA-binding domain-containing protein [Propionibacteriaceae bacterium]